MRNALCALVLLVAVLAQGGAVAGGRMDQILDSPVSLGFKDCHLLDITKFISDSWDINIGIDWRVVALPPRLQSATSQAACVKVPGEFGPDYVTDGIVSAVNVKNIPLRAAFDALLRPLNLTFVVMPSCVWISSPAMTKADARNKKPSLRSSSKGMAAVLASPISIEFENIHLEEILAFMANSWNVNLVLDSRVVLPKGRDNAGAPLGSPGYITSGMVPYVNLKNVAFADALALLLRPMNLTFKVEKGYIWVSSYRLVNAGPLPAQAAQAHSG